MQKELKKIVLIDDDEDDRDFFKTAIDCINPQLSVLSLVDGVCLTEYLRDNVNQIPDLLFLDINMPRKNGFECLEDIRSKYNTSELPIIMYSTSESDYDILNSKNLGANLYIKKPSDFTTLKEVLSKVLNIDWSKNTNDEREFFLSR